MDSDDIRSQLHSAIAAVYHASEALKRVQQRYGPTSAEADQARAALEQAQKHVHECEVAYFQSNYLPPVHRHRPH